MKIKNKIKRFCPFMFPKKHTCILEKCLAYSFFENYDGSGWGVCTLIKSVKKEDGNIGTASWYEDEKE